MANIDKSKQQKCLRNLRSIANLDFCNEVSTYGNEVLGHIYKYTPNQIVKVLDALYSYCVDKGQEIKGAEDVCAKRIETNWIDGMIRIDTWAP